jgi:hypothetical protein
MEIYFGGLRGGGGRRWICAYVVCFLGEEWVTSHGGFFFFVLLCGYITYLLDDDDE